jgi:hypothetical protein
MGWRRKREGCAGQPSKRSGSDLNKAPVNLQGFIFRCDVCVWHKADMITVFDDVRFSDRPIGAKRFQAVQRCSVDADRGLALLYRLGTNALPAWGSKTRWNNLSVGLGLTAGSSGHTNSPHPSSREGHHSTTRWTSSFLLSSVSCRCGHPGPAELGAVNPDAVHDHRNVQSSKIVHAALLLLMLEARNHDDLVSPSA